jgi:hypothetical protein
MGACVYVVPPWRESVRLTMFYRLNGIGAGPAETAMPTIIADVIFLHDRGKYQTLYFAFYFGSLMVTPYLPST